MNSKQQPTIRHESPRLQQARSKSGGSLARERLPQWNADLALVRSAWKGDPLATQSLLARLDCVPHFLRAQAGRRGAQLQQADLEELTQETITRLWSRLARFEGRSTLETWVYRFVSYVYMESTRQTRQVSLDEDSMRSAVPATVRISLADRERIGQVLAQMGGPLVDVAHLRFREGLSFPAIAERLSIPLGTAKARWYRACEVLRLALRCFDNHVR